MGKYTGILPVVGAGVDGVKNLGEASLLEKDSRSVNIEDHVTGPRCISDA